MAGQPGQSTAPAESPFDIEADEEPLRRTPPKDPETGRFVKPAEAAPSAVSQAVKHDHPHWLVTAAQDYGFTVEEIEETPTNLLARAIHNMQQRTLQFREQQERQRTVQEGQVKPPPPAPTEEVLDFAGLEQRYEPDLVSAFKKLAQAQKDKDAEIKKLREELTASEQRTQQRHLKSSADILDAAFARVVKARPHLARLLGNETADKLQGKQELRRRVGVLSEAGVKFDEINPALIVRQLADACDVLYPADAAGPAAPAEKPNPYATPKGKPANGAAPREEPITPERWNSAGLAQPTHRTGAAEPSGDVKAVRNLETKMRDAGMLDDESELDGLL